MPPRLGALLAVLFWGVSFVATKAAVDECRPLALVVARTALGAALIIVILAWRGERLRPPRATWPALLGMGFVGVAFHQGLQAYALTLTTAARTGWLVGLTPVWSALFAAWRLREILSAAKVVGLAMGLAGALVVITRGRLAPELLALPATQGDLLVLASTLNWAFYSVLGHPTLRRLGPRLATAGALVAGLLLLLPAFLWQRAWVDLARLSPTGWAAVAFLGLACSGLGYLFWYAALEHVDAARVAAFLYLEPLVTLVAAMTLLGEAVAPSTVAGGLLLVAGVVVVQRAE